MQQGCCAKHVLAHRIASISFVRRQAGGSSEKVLLTHTVRRGAGAVSELPHARKYCRQQTTVERRLLRATDSLRVEKTYINQQLKSLHDPACSPASRYDDVIYF